MYFINYDKFLYKKLWLFYQHIKNCDNNIMYWKPTVKHYQLIKSKLNPNYLLWMVKYIIIFANTFVEQVIGESSKPIEINVIEESN